MTTREFPPLPVNSRWVEEKLAQLSLDQKIGQLLHPNFWPTSTPEQLEEALGDVEPGGVFLHPGPGEAFQKTAEWLKARCPAPVLISSDLENGAGRMINGATVFPEMMSLAAANNEHYAYQMGRSAAVEGRAFGVHWSFGPVVDINANPHSPGGNAGALGDDPQRVARLSADTNTQAAVLQALTGELEASGASPVDLEAPYRFKSQEGLRYIL